MNRRDYSAALIRVEKYLETYIARRWWDPRNSEGKKIRV